MCIQRFIFITLLIVLLSFFASCDVDSGKKFFAKPRSLDFGEVYLGEQKELECVLRSNIDSSISITNIELTGSNCFEVTPTGSNSIIIHANSDLTIKITYTPIAKIVDEAKLIITASLQLYPKEIKLTGTGIGYAKMNVNPEQLEFKAVVKNQSLTESVDIENFGIEDLEITKLKITGTDAGKFSITVGGSTPRNIPPGAVHTIYIKFSPTEGCNCNANLEIVHNGINVESPYLLKLVGEGLDMEPKIGLNRSSPWDFGLLSTCFTISERVKVKNIGIDPLYIRDIQLQSGVVYSIKSIYSNNIDIKNVPYTILPGKELEVEIEFAPVANIQYNDKLSIDHNGMNESNPLVLDIVGIGNPITTRVFQYIGSSEQFVVPAGVTRLKLELWGAEGGGTYPIYNGTDPGKGGYVVGFMNVNPGETYEIYVGGKGQNGVLGAGGLGGWNGGGFGDSYPGPQQFGGGGGGASDLRFGGNTYYDRIIVSGAGGGASAHMANCDGGAGGDLIGGNGTLNGLYDNSRCGGGGTQKQGGSEADIPFTTYWGEFGYGGNADDIHSYEDGCGGGGGGGWYGGGAGNTGGAGGGSSYTDPHKIFDEQHQQGIHTGNGRITITY